MSRTLTPLVISNTFENWFELTNDIVDVLEDVVTIGDDETNTGNIVIDGDISSTGVVYTDTIDVNGIVTANISLLKPISITHNTDTAITLLRESTSETGRIGIDWVFNAEPKWETYVNEDHQKYVITKLDGPAFALSLEPTVDGLAGLMVGQNLKLDGSLFPSVLEGVTAEAASRWANARTVTFGDDVVGSFTIDGSQDVTCNLSVKNDSHTHDTRYYTQETSDSRFIKVSGKTWREGKFRIQDGFALEWGQVGLSPVQGETDPVDLAPVSSIQSSSTIFGITTDKKFEILIENGKAFEIKGQPTGGSQAVLLSLSGGQTGDLQVKGEITAKANLSDRRKKENIEKIENALDKIEQLNGYTFNYIGDNERMTGVMADEVKAVLPEVVYKTEKDGDVVDAVRYGNMMGLMIEAIKELRREIAEIKRG